VDGWVDGSKSRFKDCLQQSKINSDGMAESAKVSVGRPLDPVSDLGSERKYFLILFVSHLNSNL
jgi:hypothetical protein